MRKVEAGVIGLGNMGAGVAGNFVRAGVPLAVWDVNDAALDRFRGGDGVAVMEPGEMAAEGATIFYVVPATPEIEASLDGDGGVLARAAEGLVVYDLTTSNPADTKRVAEGAAAQGVSYLDAAMSGGAAGADQGTLTLMIGGDKEAFERSRRYLDPIAKEIFHLGPSGAGHTMKLIHNMACHTIFLATCEAGRMAERAGIKLEDMIGVFNVSNARSYASEERFPRHILSGAWDARSRVYNLRKDLAMAVAMGEELGADATFGRETLAMLEAAVRLGMEERDYSLLYRHLDEIHAEAKAKSP